jgi:hypothetical protein
MFRHSSVARTVTSCGLLAAILVSAHPPIAAAEQPAIVDPRVSTYAERQVIRDQYRGQIDVLTFNDELGDGVPLEQALADALNAAHVPSSGRIMR